jgi:hypothetical protein
MSQNNRINGSGQNLNGQSRHSRTLGEYFSPRNRVANGNFVGTTGWSAISSANTAASNTLSNTGAATVTKIYYAYHNTTLTVAAGHRYYCRAKLRMTTATTPNTISINIDGASGGTDAIVGSQATPAQNTWYTVSGVASPTDQSGLLRVILEHKYANNSEGNAQILECQEALCVELTACLPAWVLAKSDADLKTWCDANMPIWFDGTVKHEI